MYKIVPTTIEHFLQLKRQNVFDTIDIQETGSAILSVGVSFTILNADGIPLGCGGVIPRWAGVGEVWIAISEELKKHPLVLVRETLRCIDAIVRYGGFRRLQLTIRSENELLKKWAASLGFTSEGRMLRYGIDGSDHDLFARIF